MNRAFDPPLTYATPQIERANPQQRVGLACALGAYLSWGFVPMYFKLLTHVPALNVLAHRIVWSAIFLAIVAAIRGGADGLRVSLRRRDVWLALTASTFLIAVNWYTFIYAIEHNALLQASLGYFINPLVNVLLGILILRERLRPWQLVGLVLAAMGVLILTLYLGQVPWIALILAISFGLYGLLRKTMHIGSMAGLTVETWILFLPSLAVIALDWSRDPQRVTSLGLPTHSLLALAGVVTAVPLLMFAAGARRLRLSTMGFLQYIAPSCQFLLAVVLYKEPFTAVHLMTFACIWGAQAIYTTDSYVEFRRRSLLPPHARDERANPPT